MWALVIYFMSTDATTGAYIPHVNFEHIVLYQDAQSCEADRKHHRYDSGVTGAALGRVYVPSGAVWECVQAHPAATPGS
jgi:hypothetical protein